MSRYDEEKIAETRQRIAHLFGGDGEHEAPAVDGWGASPSDRKVEALIAKARGFVDSAIAADGAEIVDRIETAKTTRRAAAG